MQFGTIPVLATKYEPGVCLKPELAALVDQALDFPESVSGNIFHISVINYYNY